MLASSIPTAEPKSEAPTLEENRETAEHKTICVTGAAGYLGSWLVKLCLDQGYNVRACVRSVNDEIKVGFLKCMPFSEYGPKLTLHAADMTVPGAYDSIFEGCSTVFHPAEVLMSKEGTHDIAVHVSRNVADSINKSTTVTRLVYTSSIAAMIEPPPDSYATTKRLLETFFGDSASASRGKWSVLIGNPADIIGPILSPHHAAQTLCAKIGRVVQGESLGGRPRNLVDVRDVALAQILLAESKSIASGTRFLLASGHTLFPEEIGVRVMEFHPDWNCPVNAAPEGAKGRETDNTPICEATGIKFRTFDDMFRGTVDSLVTIGGLQPLKS